MEIIEVSVEYPSGLVITDRATLITGLDQVCISERLGSIIREFSTSEAPPVYAGRAAGRSVTLHANPDGTLKFEGEWVDVAENDQGGLWSRLGAMINAPTRDQRQQFGRFMHTLSAASLIGAIGFWHSTTSWTTGNILSEANLILAFVLTFYVGMVSMNGE
ncbi:hypothetical protein SAMN05443245_7462 [Paraburkholderia fungorum]|uniref:Uncharacterized protein n=1 Tax=Paraburkholderia fungorum TaxID=134537 RepID=A0A1H1JXU6_9BURK|nr:hypothetical protein [Paraburkholderia fungorum]SDR54589.1 hypothetical protein SAMN05443245_7462 [Paraburkholderia fungorum]